MFECELEKSFYSTKTYAKNMVESKQISVTMPSKLFESSKNYVKEFGYKSVQELILELMRERIMEKNLERYEKIEKEMKKNAKNYTQAEAIEHLRKL